MYTTNLTSPVAELDEKSLENVSRAIVRNPTSLVTKLTSNYPYASEFQTRKKNVYLKLDKNSTRYLDDSCDERANIRKVETTK